MAVTCQMCKANPAKIHYTEVVNNAMVSVDLCLACAAEKGIDVESTGPYGLGDLVAGLIDTAVTADSDRIGRVRCPECGYEFSDFKKIGRFGCAGCYSAFEAQLLPMLRHVHGAVQHTGKVPPAARSRGAARVQMTTLREALAQAVKSEDYESAARIRDEIRQLEQEVASDE